MKPIAMKRILIFILLILFGSPLVYGWGGEGHQAIGQTAAGLLNAEAKAHIQTILGNTDLGAIATWMDEARALDSNRTNHLTSQQKPEARAFNSKFPHNSQWHFVNLPVGSKVGYRTNSPFASEDDIVHAINEAIDVLEGRSRQYSKVQALRVLTHMVGDIHQPLHCVSGYYDVSDLKHPKIVLDTQKAKNKPDDRGGNQLFYTKTQELHALWDTDLVEKIGKDPAAVASRLKKMSTSSKWMTKGDYHRWASAWANESAMEGVKAYKGIQFGAATLNEDLQIERIEVTLPGGTKAYKTAQTNRARTQMAKAAVHLAQLLNSIRYQ